VALWLHGGTRARACTDTRVHQPQRGASAHLRHETARPRTQELATSLGLNIVVLPESRLYRYSWLPGQHPSLRTYRSSRYPECSQRCAARSKDPQVRGAWQLEEFENPSINEHVKMRAAQHLHRPLSCLAVAASAS
jgi:hypothetical protein